MKPMAKVYTGLIMVFLFAPIMILLVFSFNGATGERTAAKGYKEAAAISGGQSRDEVGGGVCQTSSTLFNAVVRADLEIIERNPHAWPSN